MKDIQEYINKIEQMSKSQTNVRCMPVTKEHIKNNINNMDAIEDYKEVKEIVEEWEKELGNLGREAAPVPIPVRTKDK